MTPRAELGICIPTYKRPDQLRRCVTSVIRSAAPHGVPVFVADDSADDTNLAVIEELRATYPLVVHHRNAENLGIDRNILGAVDLCDRRHAWILGEDDRLTPEAVPTILAALGSGDRSFVYVNYASVDEEVSLVLAERSLPLITDSEMSAEGFLAECAWSIGFIGACVVDTILWHHVSPEPYIGTYFAHVGRIMEYLRGRRVHLVARPVVLNRCGAARAFSWRDSTFDVLHGWARMIDLLTGYPDDVRALAKASFRRAHGIGSLAFFAYLRADRALDANAWSRHVRQGPYGPLQRAAAWAIARTPPQVFGAARRALTAARRARNRRVEGY